MNTKKVVTQIFLFNALLLGFVVQAQATLVFTSLHSFGIYTNGAHPLGTLVQGSDGNFYGTTYSGGTNGGYGTVFEITTNGTITLLHSFTGGNDGGNPQSGLILGSDGNIYGTTDDGGLYGDGTIFRVSSNGVFSSFYSFLYSLGSHPNELAQDSDGNFYGTTANGGTNGAGTVFKISLTGTFTSLHSFGRVTYNGHGYDTNSDGYYPEAALTLGPDGNFYGITTYGGTNGAGTVFEVTTNGVLTTLHTFSAANTSYPFTNSDGAEPEAALILGLDGNFYGTTIDDGPNGYGTVFKMSASGTLTTLFSFNNTDGGSPGCLVQGSDGNFYGTTYNGGYQSSGTVFKMSSNGALTSLYYFTGFGDGGGPGNLVLGSDGNFYGTTYGGGTNQVGTVFQITAGGAFTSLYSFTGSIDGANPEAALTQGDDGNLYGTTYNGGTSNNGAVFAMGASGAVTNLYSFTGFNDGGQPEASLVQGSDGYFYGTTSSGGTGAGTAFKISPSGALTSLHTFGFGDDGVFPYGGLAQGSDGNFYGTTAQGGTNYQGTVFKMTADGTCTILYSFTGGNDGGWPYGALVQGNDGFFYGTTSVDGTNSDGTVFKISAGGVLTTLYSFTGGNDGANPYAGLVEGSDGNFYGTTEYGGANYAGTVFKISARGILTPLYSFTGGNDGGQPQAALIQGSDGNFYGTTGYGGASGWGTVFEITASGVFTSLYSFTGGSDGGYPDAGLVQGFDGKFYGTTANGGIGGNGTAFSLSTGLTGHTIVQFTAVPTTGPAPLDVQFNCPGVDNSLSNIVDWNWSFGDGATSTLQNPSHTYTSLGTFKPTLVATNVNGTTVIASGPQITAFAVSGSFTYLTNNGTVTITGYLGPMGGLMTIPDTINGMPVTAIGSAAFEGDALTSVTLPSSVTNIGDYAFEDCTNLTSAYFLGNAPPDDGTVFSGDLTTVYYMSGPTGWGATFGGVAAAVLGGNVTFTSLYSFTGGNDGSQPYAGLVQGNDGNFYGTTWQGGTNSYGTVFKISVGGAYASLHSFTDGTDGSYPNAGLTLGSDGNLYGTTSTGGGTISDGTVFKMTDGGALTHLYTFTGGNDGGQVQAGLVQGSDGNFYGTTEEGGLYGSGTVFKISASGAFRSLYSFTGGNDGASPQAGLVQGTDGFFYGTTESGGTNGGGTVFKISAAGSFTSLYSFTGGNDGWAPMDELVQGRDGDFYGTAFSGGANGSGTVFKISAGGTFTTVYSFNGGNEGEGANPEAGLIIGSDGDFYGTTMGGGTNGVGVAYKISAAGVMTSLYSFAGTGGLGTQGGLVQGSDGNFYGTIIGGGNDGNGAVFSLSTGLPGKFPFIQFLASLTNGPGPLTVQFDSPAVDSLGDAITNWIWNFGDGTTSTAQDPSHTYTTIGTFTPALVATNINGAAIIGYGPQITVSPTNLVQNGGFETGDFGGWTTSGNFESCFVTTDPAYVYSGIYGAELGPGGTPGYLSQTLTTVPGQAYLVSFWLNSPDGLTPNEFIAEWNGNTIFSETNIPAIGWTNIQSIVTATAANTVLEFGFLDDSGHFGLDGVSVVPVSSAAIGFTATPTNGQSPLSVQFNSPATDSLGNAIASWNWNFGDGATSAIQDPSHTYAATGTFTPTLVATDADDIVVTGFGPQIVVSSAASSSNSISPFLWSERLATAASWPDGEPNVGLALDANDNCYVTGWFDDTNNFGGTTLTNQSMLGGSDIFVAKYNSTGALQWARQAGGTPGTASDGDSNNGRGIGLDTNGNIYVSGGYYGPAGFGPYTLSSPSSAYEGFYLARYDNAGAVQWVQNAVGPVDNIYGIGLTVDGAGNSYALVFINSNDGETITFGSVNVPVPADDGADTILVKYNNAGTAQWAVLLGGSDEVYATRLAVDANGNVYARGTFYSTLVIGSTTLTVSAGSSENAFLAKFNSSGTLVWIQQPQGNSGEGGVAVDPAGNVFVSGYFNTNLVFGGGITLTNMANSSALFGDAFLAKYNSAGAIQWAQSAGGTNGGFYWDLALDAQTNVYAAGFLGSDAAVAKYSPAGTLQWTYSASGSPASPVSSGVAKCAVDSTGNCYLNGFYQGTATFGTNTLQPQEAWNFFLAEVASSTSTQTQYTFGSEVQSTLSASLTYDSGTDVFQYTDAANSTEDFAYLPLTGTPATFITTTNGWTSSINVNISPTSMTVASGNSAHVVMGLILVSGNIGNEFVFIFSAQDNNTGGGDDQIYPDGWYGTAIRFGALTNTVENVTTPLGNSLPSSDGSVYLPLSGGTSATAGTESFSAVTGVLTLTYNNSANTVTGSYNGTPVGSYSLASWGANPPLALAVWGGSGSGNAVLAGTDTANDFSVSSSMPNPAIQTTGAGFGVQNDQFGFDITGGNGSVVVIESTTNLANPVWIPLATNTLANGASSFSDPQSTNGGRRFYRVVSP